MRRALLALLILALAGPALAGGATPAVQPKPQPKAASTPAQAPVDTRSFALPPPIPLAVGRPGGDALQCKAACARTLYFCQANGEDDSCATRWAQCNAACIATYTPARFGR